MSPRSVLKLPFLVLVLILHSVDFAFTQHFGKGSSPTLKYQNVSNVSYFSFLKAKQNGPTRLVFCQVKTCLWPDKWLACGQKLFASFICFNVIIKIKNWILNISCLGPVTLDLWPITHDLWPVIRDLWPVTCGLDPLPSPKRRPPDETGVLAIIESWIKFLFFPLVRSVSSSAFAECIINSFNAKANSEYFPKNYRPIAVVETSRSDLHSGEVGSAVASWTLAYSPYSIKPFNWASQFVDRQDKFNLILNHAFPCCFHRWHAEEPIGRARKLSTSYRMYRSFPISSRIHRKQVRCRLHIFFELKGKVECNIFLLFS